MGGKPRAKPEQHPEVHKVVEETDWHTKRPPWADGVWFEVWYEDGFSFKLSGKYKTIEKAVESRDRHRKFVEAIIYQVDFAPPVRIKVIEKVPINKKHGVTVGRIYDNARALPKDGRSSLVFSVMGDAGEEVKFYRHEVTCLKK